MLLERNGLFDQFLERLPALGQLVELRLNCAIAITTQRVHGIKRHALDGQPNHPGDQGNAASGRGIELLAQADGHLQRRLCGVLISRLAVRSRQTNHVLSQGSHLGQLRERHAPRRGHVGICFRVARRAISFLVRLNPFDRIITKPLRSGGQFLRRLVGLARSEVIQRQKIVGQRVIRGRFLEGLQPGAPLGRRSVFVQHGLEGHLGVAGIFFHGLAQQSGLAGSAVGGKQAGGIPVILIKVAFELSRVQPRDFVSMDQTGNKSAGFLRSRRRSGFLPRPNRARANPAKAS